MKIDFFTFDAPKRVPKEYQAWQREVALLKELQVRHIFGGEDLAADVQAAEESTAVKKMICVDVWMTALDQPDQRFSLVD